MHLARLLVQYPQSTRVSPIVNHLRAVRRYVPTSLALIGVFPILFCALAASGAQAVTVGNDPETTATDPNAARAAKLQSASDSLEGLHFAQAVERARDVLAITKDRREITRAEEIILDATRYQSGCKAALDEAKRMLSQARQLRPENAEGISIVEKRIADFQDEVETYSKALEAQKQIKSASPGTAQAADATYRIARLMCYYGSQDEAIYALRDLVDEAAKSDGQVGDSNSTAAVGEAVATLKKLCLTRSGPDEAIRQLKEVAASHILDDAGAHAWNCIGDVYRSQGKTDLAEEAYLTVDRMYASSPVRYTAMMSAGDMYDAVAKTFVHMERGRYVGDRLSAVEAWKKAYEYYPEQHRKLETQFVVGTFLFEADRLEEAAHYLAQVRAAPPEQSYPDLYQHATYWLACSVYYLGYEDVAGDLFTEILKVSKDEARKERAREFLESIERKR